MADDAAFRTPASGAEPSAPEQPRPQVQVAQGRLAGRETRGIKVFKGIPYAAPPVGPLRFQAPQPALPWEGVREAVKFGAQCPQVGVLATGIYGNGGGTKPPESEDCLFLNVWTPATDGARRPVMVWLHGGAFESGSGSVAWYDGTELAKRGDVLVVTLNHRLNVFGFGYVAGIEGAGDPDSGQAGMLDIVAALRWVRENIAAFGGDPGNVTVLGESGGAAKVGLLMAMPAAQGLFHRGIAQSGVALRVRELAAATANMQTLVDHLGGGAAGVERMRTLAAEDLLKAMTDALQIDAAALPGARTIYPVVDGRNLPAQPFEPAAPAISAGVALMLGATRTETSRLIGAREPDSFGLDMDGLHRKLAARYPDADVAAMVKTFQASEPGADPTRLFFLITTAASTRRDTEVAAERKAALGAAPAFLYDLTWPTPVDGGRWGSPHALDVPIVFGNIALSPTLTGPVTPELTAVTQAMMDAWIAFARSGDPSTAERPWPAFDLAHRQTMLFDVDSRAVADPYGAEREAVDGMPPERAI